MTPIGKAYRGGSAAGGTTRPPTRQMFVLCGQSNMKGTTPADPGDADAVARVWKMDASNDWVAASHPVHPGGQFGLCVDFSTTLLKQLPSDQEIGLVPCAVGASTLSTWEEGGVNYDAMIVKAQLAQKSGPIAGFLWHQGEGDSSDAGLAASYAARFEPAIEAMRGELGVPNAPFIIGELGEFFGAAHRATVDAAHQSVAAAITNGSYVDSAGLTDRGDSVHFDRASFIVFGQRYATQYLTVA